jgi:hypothetical protein
MGSHKSSVCCSELTYHPGAVLTIFAGPAMPRNYTTYTMRSSTMLSSISSVSSKTTFVYFSSLQSTIPTYRPTSLWCCILYTMSSASMTQMNWSTIVTQRQMSGVVLMIAAHLPMDLPLKQHTFVMRFLSRCGMTTLQKGSTEEHLCHLVQTE